MLKSALVYSMRLQPEQSKAANSPAKRPLPLDGLDCSREIKSCRHLFSRQPMPFSPLQACWQTTLTARTNNEVASRLLDRDKIRIEFS
jgi:hypothetical protein